MILDHVTPSESSSDSSARSTLSSLEGCVEQLAREANESEDPDDLEGDFLCPEGITRMPFAPCRSKRSMKMAGLPRCVTFTQLLPLSVENVAPLTMENVKNRKPYPIPMPRGGGPSYDSSVMGEDAATPLNSPKGDGKMYNGYGACDV